MVPGAFGMTGVVVVCSSTSDDSRDLARTCMGEVYSGVVSSVSGARSGKDIGNASFLEEGL